MAEPLLQRNVRVRRIIAVDQKTAQALGDPVRMQILEALAHKPMSAEELTKALASAGQKKAITTIRHHLDALKNAGLIETTKMVEVRGAVMKYYGPVVRVFDFDTPSGTDDIHSKLIQETSSKLLKILRSIQVDKRFLSGFEKNNVACPFCKGNHSREKAAMEILNYSLARAMEGGDYAGLLALGKEAR
jgi:DNA-binding transcriptional ArsR family regulator